MSNIRLNDLRLLIVEATQKPRIYDVADETIRDNIMKIAKQVELNQEQEFVFGMITDGVTEIREAVRLFWEMDEISKIPTIPVIQTQIIEHYNRCINIEIKRIMTLVVSAVTPGDLHPMDSTSKYDDFAVATLRHQTALSENIRKTITELRLLGGK